MESSKKIPKGQLELDHKLDKDLSTLPAVSSPLVDTDKLVVNRAGVDYSVDKSELKTKKTHRYEFFVQNTFAASTLWYGLRRNVANTLYNALFITGYYNSISNVIEESRIWGHPITYNQKITKIFINSETVNDTIDVRFQYYENPPLIDTSLITINNHTIYDINIPLKLNYRTLTEFTPTAYTMSKGGYLTILLNNNNVISDVRTMSIIVETEEV